MEYSSSNAVAIGLDDDFLAIAGKTSGMPTHAACVITRAAFSALTFSNAAAAAPASQPSEGPLALPIADSHITSKAKEWFRRFQTGEIDRSQLDAQVNTQLTDDMVRQETAALMPLGDPAGFTYVRTYAVGGALEYDFLLQFRAARAIELISFDNGGKIAGLGFQVFGPSQR